jgi:hypothetical protein
MTAPAAGSLTGLRSRTGAVIALVPAPIGEVGGASLGRALTHGYQPAMIVMGGLCVAAALITALFVTNGRTADCLSHRRTIMTAEPVNYER